MEGMERVEGVVRGIIYRSLREMWGPHPPHPSTPPLSLPVQDRRFIDWWPLTPFFPFCVPLNITVAFAPCFTQFG